MSLRAGERLGPYEILGGLGAGGMGDVYRARDPRLGRTVAIKVLPATFSADPSRRHRFEQEARAAGQLNHPDVLAVYDVGDHEDSPYLVTELLEGETLRERLQVGALPVRKAADCALQVARGLAAAHDKGIVHRDLKPENLFLTKDGIVKILDFGLARLERVPEPGSEETATATTGTEPGTVMGTVGYMSPEQVRGEAADHRSDLFALGAVLYEMLTGRRAFHRDSSVETLNAILKEEPAEFPPDRQIPPGLDRIVRHCLEKKPEDRYQSARDLAFELEGLTGSSVTAAKAVAPAVGRWRRGLVGAAVGLAALAALAGAFLAGRRTAPPMIPGFRQLTFRRGAVASARFTPDGQTVIYSAAWDGQPLEIASMRTDGPESKPLGLPPGYVASVSSKGELAVVLTSEPHGEASGTLARVPLSGGAPREIADDVWCADWAPDGENLVVRRTPGLWQIEYPIGHVISPFSLGCPRFSPDGSRIGYPTVGGWAIFEPTSGRTSHVTGIPDRWHWGWWAWSPRGDEIWFPAGDEPEQRPIEAVSLAGRRRLLVRIAGGASVLDVSRDGRLLIEHSVARFGVRGRGPGEATERELSVFDRTTLFDLSADGRRVLLSESGSAAGPVPRAYLRATDGSEPVRLGQGEPLSLSPDGRWFAQSIGSILQGPDSWQGSRLRLVPTGPGETREVAFPDLVVHWAGWLPDGQRLLLTARERARPLRVFVAGLDGKGLRAITPEGVFPRAAATHGWTVAVSDGRRLAVEGPSGVLTLYSIDGLDLPREVPGLEPAFHAVRFADDGRSLFVVAHQGTPTRLYRVDLATGRRALAHELMPPDPIGVTTFTGAFVTPDGRAYAYGYRQVIGNLYLVEGLP
jgi:hypothetical protein